MSVYDYALSWYPQLAYTATFTHRLDCRNSCSDTIGSVLVFVARFVVIILVFLADDPFPGQRERMVREQIESRGVHNPDVLRALRSTPRHLFVLPTWSVWWSKQQPGRRTSSS